MPAMSETEPEAFDETTPEPTADPVQTINFDEAKEALAARGRERGFVSSEDLLEGLPVEDLPACFADRRMRAKQVAHRRAPLRLPIPSDPSSNAPSAPDCPSSKASASASSPCSTMSPA